MSSFNAGNYNTAISRSASAELISRSSTPTTTTPRVRSCVCASNTFFSAASIADILQNHLNQYGALDNLADKVAIQLNDTHPTVAIPEMMRILLDSAATSGTPPSTSAARSLPTPTTPVAGEALENGTRIFRNTLPPVSGRSSARWTAAAALTWPKAFPGDPGQDRLWRSSATTRSAPPTSAPTPATPSTASQAAQ